VADPVAPADDNASIWKSDAMFQQWLTGLDTRERKRADQLAFLAQMLPFEKLDRFRFVDLGAGTGSAARAILSNFPNASAILADYSPQMMDEGGRRMQPYAGRYEYVEVDLLNTHLVDALPGELDAIVTSQCVHHLPHERKQSLFAEILGQLADGSWFLNFDPVQAADEAVAAEWQRVNDRLDPQVAYQRTHRTPMEESRHANHVRYMLSLDEQVGYLRAAGFDAVDVYWKQLDFVIYGGKRPLAGGQRGQ
jgi:tRNA (cmo5U34)-methyltransferase